MYTFYKLIFVGIGLIAALQSFSQMPITPPSQYSSGTPVNYVRVWEPLKPYTSVSDVINTGRTTKEVRQTTQYMDGLGRPVQTVVKNGSLETGGTQYDLVMPVVYDAFGREQFKYLPYASATESNGNFKNNPFAEQVAFYNTQLTGQPGETNLGTNNLNWAYSKTNFEASPLNRIKEAYAPGASWVGSEGGSTPHPVKMHYWINTTNDAVRIWTVNNVTNSFGTYSTTAAYPAGELYKNVTEDEHGKQVIEFKDKEGKVILKKVQLTASAETENGTGSGHSGWICTYYIYDDLNNLRAVIQPEGVKLLDGSNWANCNPINTSIYPQVLPEQTFRYEYDHRNRMIMKKVPGAGEVYMVYDARDRLVMTQDANMRTGTVKWLYTKYDVLNRPVETGLWNNNSSFSSHQTGANSSTDYPTLSGTWEILTKTFYDNYDWLSLNGNPFSANRNTDFDHVFLTPSETDYPYPQSLIQNFQTKGMVTGSMVKVLGTSQYLYTINSYDDKGRVIQVRTKNITDWVDVLTTQYDFSGKPLVQYSVNPKNFSPSQTDYVLTKYNYDDLGRVADIKKTMASHIGGSTWIGSPEVQVVKNEYDKLGQLKKKEIGKKRDISNPAQYTSTPIETLAYEYNIRGWMLGINRDYARDANSTNYFGFDLGYDKIANNLISNKSYTKAQFNSNIGGMVWKSKGDGEKRKYDFDYDAANRLLRADFTQYTEGNFNLNAGINFSVKMGDGTDPLSAYDANGNIKRMQQWGLKLTASEQIDDLRYTYETNSNKLRNVIDFHDHHDTKLGDFRTSMNHPQKTNKSNYVGSGSGNVYDIVDYTYDANGNLKKDLNKDMGNGSSDGIVYNHLNLPSVITVRKPDGTIKGTITYTYDAAGNKLKKVVDEYPSNTNGNISTITTTTYIGGFVYESKVDTNPNTTDYNNKLQFGGHEEGRIRALYNDNNNPHTLTGFAYDYMLKDHLGNVRMVLTDEVKTDPYPVASLEAATLTDEKKYYNIPDVSNVRVLKSSVPGYPNDTYTNPNDYVHKLRGDGTKVGTTIVLKVMAGDKFNIRANSWYKLNGSNPDAPNNAVSAISSLLASGLQSATGGKALSTDFGTNGSFFTDVFNFFRTNQNSSDGTNKPKAYLNWVLFDEQFKYEYQSSGFDQVGGDNVFKTHERNNLEVTKSGYLYIYVSNETPNIDVFFDNLQVTHVRGPILEETHYYPFGLVMSGISSKAANTLENRKKFNDGTELQSSEFSDGSGLELYATSFRSLDPQLGRFWQIDPLLEVHYDYTPYNYVLNNPLRYNDPLGLDTVRVSGEGAHKIKVRQGDVLAWTIGETTSYYTYDPKNKDAVGGFVGGGIQSNKELPEVVVTGNKHKNYFTPSFVGTSMMISGAVGFTPLHKSWLPKLPKFIVGPYGRDFVKGTPLTSIASLTSRRLGLGGEFGRAFPLRSNLAGITWTGLEIHTRITTDKEFMDYYDKVNTQNPYKGFLTDGYNLIRIDYQKIELQEKKYTDNNKKNPYSGFIF